MEIKNKCPHFLLVAKKVTKRDREQKAKKLPNKLLFSRNKEKNTMYMLCQYTLVLCQVPRDYKTLKTLLLYKSRISLLCIPGKVYARVLTCRPQKITWAKTAKEQVSSRK